MPLSEFEFLLTRSGQRLLDAAMTAYDDTNALAVNARLRRLGDGYSAEQVAAAMTQSALRRRAVTKFGADAATMYFTRDGLEQATAPIVAEWRAGRVAQRMPGGRLADLGCGIGSDLVAFARQGLDVEGVDHDAVTAAVAAANLDSMHLPGVARAAAAESVDLTDYDVVFADPARRSGTGRVFDPRAFSPDWDFVVAMLGVSAHGVDRPRRAVVKLAPGLDHALVPPGVEAEWVSLDGDLKEAVLWSPAADPSATSSRAPRRATVLRADGRRATRLGTPDEAAGRVAEVGRLVYEPDAAVVRAHLVSTVASETAGWLLDPHLAYVSSDREVSTPFARGFRVVEVLPFQERALRVALRSRDVGPLTIKKRGIDVRPEDLRRRLALRGSVPATLILTRTPGSAAALLVEPVD